MKFFWRSFVNNEKVSLYSPNTYQVQYWFDKNCRSDRYVIQKEALPTANVITKDNPAVALGATQSPLPSFTSSSLPQNK